jgi:Xaa-Pro aminopeptidase
MPNFPRLRALMVDRSLDAVVAATRENLIYLTGFDPVVKTLNPYHGHCYAVCLRDGPDEVHVVHSLGEADQLLDARTPIGRREFYGVFYREDCGQAVLSPSELSLKTMMDAAALGAAPTAALAAMLQALGLSGARVALDEDGCPPGLEAALAADLPSLRLHAGSEVIRAARRVKTRDEIERLTYVARATETAIASAATLGAEGATEAEIALRFELALCEAGVRPALTMLKVGRGAVGGQMRQRADISVRPNDLLWFDCDAVCDGYWSDIARVFAVGRLPPRTERYEALHRGQIAAIENIRPGMTGDEVFRLTMAAVHAAGFPEYRRHHVGHGIGLEPYERPILAPGNCDVVEAGMILSVETPYYEFGFGALHVEDPILIGERANQRLTRQSGDLVVLDARLPEETLHAPSV